VTFVDLRQRAIAPAELRRFGQRFGATALIDKESRAFRDAGLGYLRMAEDEAFERILANQALLNLPLIRFENELSVGRNEAAWRRWLA